MVFQVSEPDVSVGSETNEICENLVSSLNRHKTNTDKFILDCKTAFDRLTSKAKGNGIPGETKNSLESFGRLCEGDLNQRLWAESKDTVGSLRAFGEQLSPVLERFEKKLLALPADEQPSQYIEFDAAIWETFRKRFQKDFSEWKSLV